MMGRAGVMMIGLMVAASGTLAEPPAACGPPGDATSEAGGRARPAKRHKDMRLGSQLAVRQPLDPVAQRLQRHRLAFANQRAGHGAA